MGRNKWFIPEIYPIVLRLPNDTFLQAENCSFRQQTKSIISKHFSWLGGSTMEICGITLHKFGVPWLSQQKLRSGEREQMMRAKGVYGVHFHTNISREWKFTFNNIIFDLNGKWWSCTQWIVARNPSIALIDIQSEWIQTLIGFISLFVFSDSQHIKCK